jgi:hypothetical protein
MANNSVLLFAMQSYGKFINYPQIKKRYLCKLKKNLLNDNENTKKTIF